MTAMGQREEVYLLGVLPPSRPLLVLCLLWVLLTAPQTKLGAALAGSQDLTRRAALPFFSLFSHSAKIQLKRIAKMQKTKGGRAFMIQPKKNIGIRK